MGREIDLEEHLNNWQSCDDEDNLGGCGYQSEECECEERVVFDLMPPRQNREEVVCAFHHVSNCKCHGTLLNGSTKQRKANLIPKINPMCIHAYLWAVMLILIVAMIEYKQKYKSFMMKSKASKIS